MNNTELFYTEFEDDSFQHIHFQYKGIDYDFTGFWAFFVRRPDMPESEMLEPLYDTKYEALNAKIFDGETKSLKDILPDIIIIDFD